MDSELHANCDSFSSREWIASAHNLNSMQSPFSFDQAPSVSFISPESVHTTSVRPSAGRAFIDCRLASQQELAGNESKQQLASQFLNQTSFPPSPVTNAPPRRNFRQRPYPSPAALPHSTHPGRLSANTGRQTHGQRKLKPRQSRLEIFVTDVNCAL